jgi:hypothetical protein
MPVPDNCLFGQVEDRPFDFVVGVLGGTKYSRRSPPLRSGGLFAYPKFK